jgi:hypothetical protein
MNLNVLYSKLKDMLPNISGVRRVSSQGAGLKLIEKSGMNQSTFIKNPFDFPFNEDLITLKEEYLRKQKRQKMDEKLKPLWQKGVKDNRVEIFSQIKNIKQSIDKSEINDLKEEPDILKAADALLKHRPRKQERTQDYINRKKEMFLIQMKIDEKQDQIRWFEEKTREKAEKLHVIEMRMKDDLDQFNAFVESNKIQTNEQIREAENETKEKLMVINRIKSLAEVKTTKLNFNLKLLEKLNSLLSYKQFLDSLSPTSVIENQKAPQEPKVEEFESSRKSNLGGLTSNLPNRIRRSSKVPTKGNIAQISNDFVKQIQDGKLKKDSSSGADHSPTKIGSNGFKDSFKKVKNTTNRRKIESQHSSFISSPESTDAKLMQMIEQLGSKTHNGLLKLIRSEKAEFPIYFKSSEQLLEMYKEIEEENLKLIKETQKLKTKSEDVEDEIVNIKKNFEKDKINMKRKKDDIIQKIKETKSNLNHNLAYSSENISEIESAIRTISSKITGLKHLVELGNKASPFEILKDIECKLVRDLDKISDIDSEFLKKFTKDFIEEQKQQYQKQANDNEKVNEEQRMNKLKSKSYKRIHGRKDIWRSFFEKRGQDTAIVVHDNHINTENEKYFT